MDREDRIKNFAKQQQKKQESETQVRTILQSQRAKKEKRQSRKQVKRKMRPIVLLAAGVCMICFVVKQGNYNRPEAAVPAQEQAVSQKEQIQIQETEPAVPAVDPVAPKDQETGQSYGQQEMPQPYEQQDSQDPVPGQDSVFYEANAGASAGFFGNTYMTTGSGLFVDIKMLQLPDWIEVRHLTVNPYSRPCVAMDSIRNIAIHYVGNAGTTADQNWSYFEGLKDSHVTKASSHFVVGLEGEVISCIPLNEMSYCTNQRNVDTISIEVCHPDAGGQFTPAAYQSVVRLTAWLCKTFGLTTENVIRHYDVTGKICPKYYVEHEDAWIQLKGDIDAALAQ